MGGRLYSCFHTLTFLTTYKLFLLINQEAIFRPHEWPGNLNQPGWFHFVGSFILNNRDEE